MSGDHLRNGDTEDEFFSLQEVYDYVNRTLVTTEEAKKTLQMECEEARYALKPWPIESTVIRKLDMNVCTCEEAWNTEEKAEEIAEEIGKTLLYSQQLREKLALNLHKERQNLRRPSLQEIYKPSPPGTAQKKPPSRPTRSASQQRPEKNNSVSKLPPRSSVTRSSSTTRPKSFDPSPDNALAKVTTTDRSARSKNQTNFILANKMSVRGKSVERSKAMSASCSEVNKLYGSSKNLSAPNHISHASSHKSLNKEKETDTLNELDKLIKKYAAVSAESATSARENCPIHAENASGEVEEKVVTAVDAVEGLDRLGIPSYMIKILKTYHAYIREELFEETPVTTKKRQEAPSTFLASFDRISRNQKSPALCQYQELLGAYSNLSNNAFKNDICPQKVKQLKLTFLNLDKYYEEFKVKETAEDTAFSKSSRNCVSYGVSIDMSNLISNGIWNYFCVYDLARLFGSYCTRYSDRNQLVSFHDLVQNIQKKVYETELIELIMLTVLPQMKALFDPSGEEFLELYKMVCSAVQIINPKSSVLVKNVSDD